MRRQGQTHVNKLRPVNPIGYLFFGTSIKRASLYDSSVYSVTPVKYQLIRGQQLCLQKYGIFTIVGCCVGIFRSHIATVAKAKHRSTLELPIVQQFLCLMLSGSEPAFLKLEVLIQ